MSATSRSVGLMSAQAMLFMIPACLYIEAERAAERISARILKQAESLAGAHAELRRRPIACAQGVDPREFLTREDVLHQVLVARRENDKVLTVEVSGVLAWAMEHGLPFSEGIAAIRRTSRALEGSLIELAFNSGFCRKRHGRIEDSAGAEAALREEEAASLEWIEHVLAVLDEHDRQLAAARTAFESDRIGLIVLSSVLWLSQVIGWGLPILIVLPREVRAWKRARTPRASPGPSSPDDG
jgi:hypothetical protein